MGRIITSLVVRKQTDGDVLKTAEKAFRVGLQISIHVFPFNLLPLEKPPVAGGNTYSSACDGGIMSFRTSQYLMRKSL